MGPGILFVDDHVAIRRGLEEILADALPNAGFGHATNSDEALKEIRKSRWHAAIVDLDLPGRGGLELIRNLKDEQPGLAILVYSVHSEQQFGLRAIRAGADGYLSKDQPPEQIVKAVLTILKGERFVSQELSAALLSSVQEAAGDSMGLLSDREIQVLRMIALGKNPSEIGAELALSPKTVSTYRARVLEKLNPRTNADLVRYAIENGMVE
jgi:two-component system, NarL family, invasion response regulator UvrY